MDQIIESMDHPLYNPDLVAVDFLVTAYQKHITWTTVLDARKSVAVFF